MIDSIAKENGIQWGIQTTMVTPVTPQANEFTERISETLANISAKKLSPLLPSSRMTFFEAFTTDIDRLTDRSFTELKYLFAKMVFELSEKENGNVN